VFMIEDGLEPIKAAPEVGVENNVQAHLEFQSKISARLGQMESPLLLPRPMQLKYEMAEQKLRQPTEYSLWMRCYDRA